LFRKISFQRVTTLSLVDCGFQRVNGYSHVYVRKYPGASAETSSRLARQLFLLNVIHYLRRAEYLKATKPESTDVGGGTVITRRRLHTLSCGQPIGNYRLFDQISALVANRQQVSRLMCSELRQTANGHGKVRMTSHSSTTNVQLNSQLRRKTEILDQCDQYAKTILQITTDLRHLDSTNLTLPNFPKAALLLMMGEIKTPKVLKGIELHNYLCSKIVTFDIDNITIPTPEEQPASSLNDLIDKLYDGYRVLKNTSAKVISASLVYGLWLQIAFHYINNPAKRTGYCGKWEKWLAVSGIGIKVSYARMLRTLGEKFCKYKRFHLLSISLNEFWNKRKEIEEMLHDNNIARQWAGHETLQVFTSQPTAPQPMHTS